MEQGLIQIYTGSGKGKSTAAFGLALRAAGAGLRVAVIQFMKPEDSNEARGLAHLPGVAVYCYGSGRFQRRGVAPQPEELALAAAAIAKAHELAADPTLDLLVLDELCNAVFFGLVEEAAVLDFLTQKPATLEVVLTGRNATPALIERADLVTEMQEIKHPYRQGVPARRGVDF